MAKHTVKESLAGTAVSYCRAENLKGTINLKSQQSVLGKMRMRIEELIIHLIA